MEQIIKGIWLGDDDDVPEGRRRHYARLACCKYGPDGHKDMLGYETPGAPQGKEYLSAREGDWMALNLLDLDDPTLIPDEVIDTGLRFIKEMYDKGKNILIHCNRGHSRGPTMTLMFLRTIGEMPETFLVAEKKFRTLYRKYDPGVGMRSHARERWRTLPNFFKTTA